MRNFIGKLPLQIVMIAPFVLIIGITVGLTGYLAFRNGQNAVNELASQLHQEVTARIQQHLDTYLAMPLLINQLNLDSISLKQLDLDNLEALEHHFLAQIQRFELVISLAYASEQGEYVSAYRKVLGVALGGAIASEKTDYRLEAYEITPQGRRTLIDSLPDYDPRARPWYQAAVQAGQPTWTPIFVWSSGDVGLDAVVPIYTADNHLVGVLDTSLTLNGLGDFLQSLPLSKNGETFIVDRSGLLIASSTITEPYRRSGDDLNRLSALESNDAVTQSATQYLEHRFGSLVNVQTSQQFYFDLAGERQFAQVTPYRSNGLDWLMVVIIPESDFMAQIKANNRTTALLIVASLLGAMVIMTLTARWVTQPVLRLNQSAEALSRGDWAQKVVLDRRDEVGQLASSFNWMAEQLQASFASLQASEERYRSLFANSLDAVLLGRPDGSILAANEAACQLFGQTEEELCQGGRSSILDVSDPRLASGLVERLHTGQFSGELTLVHQDGTKFPGEVSSSIFTDQEGELKSSIIIRDITERKRAEEMLHSIVAGTAGAVGEAFFQILVRHLASAFGVRYALIGELGESRDRIRSLAIWAGAGPAENFEYDLAGTPCANMIDQTMCIYPRDVQEIFPQDYLLAQMGVVGYCGTPLFDSSGKALGVLVVMDDQPMAEPDEKTRSLLSIFAARAAAEIERLRAEQALRKSEEKFSKAFRISPAIISISRISDGRLIEVNDAFERVLGYRRDQIIGRTTLELGLWVDLNERERSLQPLIKEGRMSDAELHFRTREGKVLTCSFSAELIEFEGIACVLATTVDITDRQQAKQEIADWKQRYELVAAASGQVVYDYNFADGLLTWGDSIEQVLGYQPSEANGGVNQWEALIDPCDYDKVLRLLDMAKKNRTSFEAEYGFRHKDGHYIHMLDRGFIVSDSTGKPERMIGVMQDITERKKVEEAHTRLAIAIEQAAESVVITDTAGAILYVNPAFERTTGYSQTEALGQTPRLLKSDQHGVAFYQELWAALTTGEIWHGRFINKKKDGSFYTEEATISPVRNESGVVVNYVAVNRDVTRELQLEQQYLQAQKLEIVGQLAGGIAHDFNNLLTVINSYAELLLDQLDEQSPLREDIKQIRRSGERAAALTRQLLAFSRKQIIQPQVLDLNTVVVEMDKMLRRLIGENIELEISLASDLWSIKADWSQIEQVIVNLAVNARDAMPMGGRLTIETANVILDESYVADHFKVQPGEYVLLAVSDTGIGMNEAVKTRIFEPFFTTKEAGQGTGLGLATSYGIVQQSQGTILVYSEEGIGSTFKVYLPRAGQVVQPSVHSPIRPEIPSGSETILLVEDDTGIRDLAHRLLQKQGYTVLEARNGQEAFRVAADFPGSIHLLLTDVVMPGVSGKILAEQLALTYPALKTLFMSGYTDNVITHQGVLDPGIAFLQKPFSPLDLARKVRTVLDV